MEKLNIYHCCDEMCFVEKNEECPYATPKCPVCNQNMTLVNETYNKPDNNKKTLGEI